MSSAWIEILQEAQKGLAYHKSGIKKLMEILKEESLESKQLLQFIFSNGFCNVMLVQKKDPSVERLSKFLIDLSICGIEWVLNMTISFLLEMSTASDKTIRTKSCLFISQIFSNMSLEAEIPDSLWESTISTLVSRLHDKIPAVRMWAIRALGRLQNPDDENDVVVSEILRLMKTDDSSQVRVAATETICVSKYSLIELVKRVKDIDPHVRSAALIHLTKDVDVRHYNSYMRNLIVGYGLQDRDETVKKTTINLIESWLKQIDYRVPKLLHMLNIMNNSKEIELFAWQLIDMIEKGQISNQDLKENLHKSSESWEGPFQSLGLSDLLWTKLRCDYGRENMPPFAGNNLINELLPPVILLCRQIEQGSRQSLEDNEAMLLTMKYLLGLTKFMRSSEEGYLQIGIVCDRLLRDIHFPMDLIDDTLAAWAGKPGDHSKVLEALHLAFDLRSQYQMACSEDNNEGNMEEQEALAFIRSLQIIQWCLQSAVEHFSGRSFQITAVFGDHLDGIIHDVVLALQQPVMELRCLAVKCVGLLGLCDSMLAESNLALIFQVASNDLEEPEIRCQALEVLCDFVLIYQQAWKHQINLVGLLVRLQEHGDAEVARVAADVSAKLLYSGVIEDVSLLAILLKFFFLSEVLQSADDDAQDRDYDPRGQLFDIGDKYRLQQILSLFFQTYFSVIKSSQASLIQAIPIFVSDISMLIRDGDIPSGLLEKVIHRLLILCSGVPSISTTSTGSTSSVLVEIKAALFAAVGRELLKLGNSREELKIAKDYLKCYGKISISSWLESQWQNDVIRVLKSINSSFNDKLIRKSIDKMIVEASKTALDSSDRLMPPLYDYAPGLLDLVSLAPDDEDLVISRPTGRSRSVKTKKATLKELSDSEDDNVDDENDDDSSQEDENNYDSDN